MLGEKGQTADLLLQEVQEELLALLRHLVADFQALAAGARLRCRREVHGCVASRDRRRPAGPPRVASPRRGDFALSAAAASAPPAAHRDGRSQSRSRSAEISRQTFRKNAETSPLAPPTKRGFRAKSKNLPKRGWEWRGRVCLRACAV